MPEEKIETIWICVYADTVEEHNEDCNLMQIQVTKAFFEQYFNECRKDSDCEWKTAAEFLDNYCADDTDDFYDYAKEHEAIMGVERWS